jgi:hypothetical protein
MTEARGGREDSGEWQPANPTVTIYISIPFSNSSSGSGSDSDSDCIRCFASIARVRCLVL